MQQICHHRPSILFNPVPVHTGQLLDPSSFCISLFLPTSRSSAVQERSFAMTAESPTTPATNSSQPSSYRPSLPSTPSSNYAQAVASTSTTSTPIQITLSDGRKIDDGRKETRSGEIVPSGASAWKPAYVRMQSWNEQDMKREYTMSSLEK